MPMLSPKNGVAAEGLYASPVDVTRPNLTCNTKAGRICVLKQAVAGILFVMLILSLDALIFFSLFSYVTLSSPFFFILTNQNDFAYIDAYIQ